MLSGRMRLAIGKLFGCPLDAQRMRWQYQVGQNRALEQTRDSKPKLEGTRLGVGLILERLGNGWSVEQLIEAYPHITEEQIQACQSYAADMLAGS